MDRYVITVARGFGSGGKQIAMQLAKELGVECYEHRILALASMYSGFDEKEFMDRNERLSGSVIIEKLASIPSLLAITPEQKRFKEHQSEHMKYYKFQEEIIRKLAETESCVIVGKCADYILRDMKDVKVISIYIDALREFCVERLKARMGVTEKEAHKLIETTDKYRADYYEFYTGGHKWNYPGNYDLMVNSSRVSEVGDLSNCITVIKHYLNLKLGIEV